MRFLDKIQQIKTYGSVHWHLEDQDVFVAATTASFEKESIDILEQKSFDSMADFTEEFPKELPIVITITGQAVVTKKVANKNQFLQEVLFTNNPDDFYIYTRANQAHQLVSVARKTLINEYLQQLQSKGFTVIDFTLGPWSLLEFSELLPAQNTIQSARHQLNVEAVEVNPITAKDNNQLEYQLSDSKIATQQVMAFASLVQHLKSAGQYVNFGHKTAQLKEDFVFKKLTKQVGVIAIAALFVLMAGSYGLSALFAQKQANIQAQLEYNNALSQQIKELEKDLAYKEGIATAESMAMDEYFSEYLWEIAASVPEEIQLLSTEIFPITGKLKPKEPIQLVPNKFKVAGLCSSTLAATNWVQKLKEISWIKEVEYTTFELVDKQYQFTLEISL